MTKPKILSLGYCFPPVASAEAYVSARILCNLENSSIDHINAASSLISGRTDNSLNDYVTKYLNHLHTVNSPWLAQYLNNSFRCLPLRPDRWILLNNAAYKKAIELDPENYQALITRSQYHSIHLVGSKLKKKFPDLPWIACFSDPWSGADHSREVPLFSWLSKRYENRVIALADALIFPTEGLAEFFARQNPNINVLSKAHIIPHTIDASLMPAPYPRDKKVSQLKGRCLGSFYGPRRVAPLLRGLRTLLEIAPEYKDQISIELIGANEEVNDQINLYNLKEYVNIKPSVDWTEAIDLMAQSDFLILVEAASDTPSFYMPSKLIDYLSVKKPIFAISPNGISADIVRNSGGLVVSPTQSANKIALGLQQINSARFVTESWREFDAKAHGKRMEDIIANLIRRP